MTLSNVDINSHILRNWSALLVPAEHSCLRVIDDGPSLGSRSPRMPPNFSCFRFGLLLPNVNNKDVKIKALGVPKPCLRTELEGLPWKSSGYPSRGTASGFPNLLATSSAQLPWS